MRAFGRFRATAVGRAIAAVRRRAVPPLCAAVHRAIRLMPPKFLPTDVRLKHVYDYTTFLVDPRVLTTAVRVGAWAVEPSGVHPKMSRMRRWWEQGGGWKSAQLHLSRSIHGGFVADGGWDEVARPFEVLPAMRELFLEGRSARDTAEYRRVAGWIAEGDFTWTRGCRTLDELDAYFESLTTLYRDIGREGYRTQRELGNDASDEIRVAVNRDGQLCVYDGGTHRLSIALLQGLDEVPVVVKRVHSRWLEEVRGSDAVIPVEAAVDRGLRDLGLRPALNGGARRASPVTTEE